MLLTTDIQITTTETVFPVQDYDLDATFLSGQVFGWEQEAGIWRGTVDARWVELSIASGGIHARTPSPTGDWRWLREFLQVDLELAAVLAAFPAQDQHLRRAVTACRGLRLLRQPSWECLASFILSSTKQIVQIRQIVRTLRERYGERVASLGDRPVFAFPTAQRIAGLTESELRACKMGFRAPYLLRAARRVATGDIDLKAIGQMDLISARQELLRLDGVGEKIADCVLLFAYGFPTAFPVDVWVRRVLTQYYFRGRQVTPARLAAFVCKHFGSQAGYAQQYLFHHIRTQRTKDSVGEVQSSK